MENSKISISQTKLDNNYLFYLFLKEINGTNGLTNNQINNLLEQYYILNSDYKNILEIFYNEVDKIKSFDKKENIKLLFEKIKSKEIFILFIFSLKLLSIKPLLLAEAKLVSGNIIASKRGLHQLSLEYDTISKSSAYYTRVNAALISLLFFDKLDNKKTNFISTDTEILIKNLLQEYEEVKKIGIEPNQIFMLMFNESINQSIISDAGVSYENRILNVLLSLGLKKENIIKIHDENDKSTEYDFSFDLDGKTFGISAKRTLRERYKQFIKTYLTSNKINISIEITLGIDLNESTAKTIRQHNTYLFVADEIYNTRTYLQNMDGVYKVSDLNLELLKNLD